MAAVPVEDVITFHLVKTIIMMVIVRTKMKKAKLLVYAQVKMIVNNLDPV